MQTADSPDLVWKDGFDVDMECLERLEEEMFERSALAGNAGDYQWAWMLEIIKTVGTHMLAHLNTGIIMTKEVVMTSCTG